MKNRSLCMLSSALSAAALGLGTLFASAAS
jgi:hypothetical protein